MTNATDTTTDSEVVRAELRAWLAEHWWSERRTREFFADAVEDRWAVPTWPKDLFGRGLPESYARMLGDEFTAAGAPNPMGTNAIATNVIKTYGTGTDLLSTVLKRFLTAEYQMCLLYSEPGAGSDLAAVQTRAERDGDEWLVNGQKVWTSGGHTATHGLLVARTDWDVPKHKGLTYFVIDMKQPGVEVRPIKQMTGESHFNEVFFTDARVPDAHRIGDVNDGWRVLQTGLAVERMIMGGGIRSNARGRAAQASAPGSAVNVDLVALAKERGLNTDGAIRQAIARMHALRRIGQWNAQRASGDADQNLASILKLAMSEVLHGTARLQSTLLGPESMLAGASSAAAQQINQSAMSAFVNSIGGGSDQIQRNIIGERVLGLPKEPQIDRDMPFRDVRKAEAVRRFS